MVPVRKHFEAGRGLGVSVEITTNRPYFASECCSAVSANYNPEYGKISFYVNNLLQSHSREREFAHFNRCIGEMSNFSIYMDKQSYLNVHTHQDW